MELRSGQNSSTIMEFLRIYSEPSRLVCDIYVAAHSIGVYVRNRPITRNPNRYIYFVVSGTYYTDQCGMY